MLNLLRPRRLALALLASTLALPAIAQAPAAPGAAPAAPAPPAAAVVQFIRLKQGLYMLTGGGGNGMLAVGSDAAVLVDTKNQGEEQFRNLTRTVGYLTDRPVKMVIDTHHHADHTGNNDRFIAAGVPVLGHQAMPAYFATYRSALATRPITPPNTVYDRRHDEIVGGVPVRAYHYDPAHTGADTVVYFPTLKAVALGDLVVGGTSTPSYDAPFGGSLKGLQRTLAQILTLDFDVAVPGHGPQPMTKAEVRAYKARIDGLVTKATRLVSANTPKDAFIAEMNKDVGTGWTLAGQFWAPPARVDALYEELAPRR